MTMKKAVSIILAIVLGCVAMSAAQPTALQRKAKTQIFEALKKVGNSISDEGDESLIFKSEGYTYRVNIHQEDNGLLYLSLLILFNLPEEYDSNIANIAALDAASNKPVCAAAWNGILMFSCEMYAKNAKPFIDVLPAMLSALKSSEEKFQDAYDEAEKEYTSTSTNTVAGNIGQANCYYYPECDNVIDGKNNGLFITCVSLNSDNTVLDMMSYNRGEYDYCYINRNSYLLVNGRKYKLIKAEGISYYPNESYYPDYQSGRDVSLSFKLIFEPLPEGTTSFDFFESPYDGWRIKGVHLDNANILPINGEKISTATHDWICESIQLQESQTVIRKSVKPKSEHTYVYSSQDEYIEDADTGRKYYLQQSSIGFEGDPHYLYDTNVIVFAEVYPALPASVRRINISSGSQYYVKGLKIR